MKLMNRPLKSLAVFSLVLLFTFGVWCASLGAPGLSVASAVSGCSQDSSALGKAGCSHPGFFCPSGTSFKFFTGAYSSGRTDDFSKGAQWLILWVDPLGSSDKVPLVAVKPSFGPAASGTQKISVHLFNSVLTL